MTMKNLSNQVIALANRNGNGVSNLELQKVMYFAIGTYIRDNGIDENITNVYNESFEAWPYGPVVRSVYFDHKMQGRRRIQLGIEPQSDLEWINPYITQYLEVPINELIEESHQHSVWADNVQAIMNHQRILYSLEDIQNEFVE